MATLFLPEVFGVIDTRDNRTPVVHMANANVEYSAIRLVPQDFQRRAVLTCDLASLHTVA